MSWFYGKGFTNLATTAIKEAQKKIDQVFDIRDNDDDDDKCNIQSVTPNSINSNTKSSEKSVKNESKTYMPNNRNNQMITVAPKPGDMVKQVHDAITSEDVVHAKEEDIVITSKDNENFTMLSSSHNNVNSNVIAIKGTISINDTLTEREDLNDKTPRPASDIFKDQPAYELHAIDSDSTHSFEDIRDSPAGDGSMELQKPPIVSHFNDEAGTTTSSDIEIISNPNGDGSSSANSNVANKSPLKLLKCSELADLPQQPSALNNNESRYKGHCREPSEISILSMDSRSEDELEKLINRVTELNNTIEALELRVLESDRQNSVLQEQNKELRIIVDATKQHESPDEFMRRISSLEKKFQASKQECNTLRSTINELRNKVPKSDITEAYNESQEIIAELKQEGEKLSKEILQQSNIIKKLRSKEKMTDLQLKSCKEQLTISNDEIERLKRTLCAREDMERSQIEAVNKLTIENQRLEKEKAQLSNKLEDITQKLNTLQHSFNAVKNELQQRSKQHTDLAKTAEIMQTVEKEKTTIQVENGRLQKEVEELRKNLRFNEQTAIEREQKLREENRKLIMRCEIAELRAESSTQEIGQTTIPLMRHLESLQQTLNQRTSNWDKEEKLLLEKLEICQKRIHELENSQADLQEQKDTLKTRCTELEEKLLQITIQKENMNINHQLELKQTENKYNKRISSLNEELELAEEKIKCLKESQQQMQHKLEQNENDVIKMQQNGNSNEIYQAIECSNKESPRTSVGHNSFDEEVLGVPSDWQQDDLESISNHGGPMHVPGVDFPNLSYNNAGTLEHLQSLLKQKDGELSQYQWEVSRLNAERNILQDEMSQLTFELEQVREKLQNCETLENNYNDLQTRYDALLQMYGEKVERTDELELDLRECKEAYKMQIQELLRKLQT